MLPLASKVSNLADVLGPEPDSALPCLSPDAQNLQHVLRGGSSDRGIAVLHLDMSKLTEAENGVFLRQMDNNIFTQIGFVVLVGLACKKRHSNCRIRQARNRSRSGSVRRRN
jgi:hypothetical protein